MTLGRRLRFACAVIHFPATCRGGTDSFVSSDEMEVSYFIFWLLVQGSNVSLKISNICISMNSYHQPDMQANLLV